MMDFKKKADEIIKLRFGIVVEHVRCHITYEQAFYRILGGEKRPGEIYGWPFPKGPYCNSDVKIPPLAKIERRNIVYVGIAADEPKRFHTLNDLKKSPLKEAKWTEAMCREWCERNDLLSPIYTTATRGGCWFCHNQSVGQLRLLRKNYPKYWTLMLKWDSDSPVKFRSDGHTVHDFERRFQMEDDGLISPDDKVFRWAMLDAELNYRIKGV